MISDGRRVDCDLQSNVCEPKNIAFVDLNECRRHYVLNKYNVTNVTILCHSQRNLGRRKIEVEDTSYCTMDRVID
jgi:hypothetical protein